MEAREQLLACARDACPNIIRKDCTQWLSEVDLALPTVVVNARDSLGHDVIEVTVTVDGQPFTTGLDGKSIPIDPGVHTFRFETKGAPPVEEKVVVHQGEKDRNLLVTFKTESDAPLPYALPPESLTTPEPRHAAGVPVASIVLAGVGVVALGSFAYFGATGRSDASNLRDTCAPSCAPSRVDDVKTKLLVADISLSAGVVAIAAAAVIYFTRPRADIVAATGRAAHRRVFDVKALPGGGMATLGREF